MSKKKLKKEARKEARKQQMKKQEVKSDHNKPQDSTFVKVTSQ